MATASAIRGPALKWWRWWSPCHSQVSWNSFTDFFLWHFKSEFWDALALSYVKEEPNWGSEQLLALSGDVVEESSFKEDSIKDFDDMVRKDDNPTTDGFGLYVV